MSDVAATEARPDTGSCYNCAFFCRHDIANTQLPGFGELTQGDRDNARYFTLSGWNLVPWCFRGEPLGTEINEARGATGTVSSSASDDERRSANEAVTGVTERRRDCPKWFAYQPGFGPREHYERWRALELERERQRRDSESRVASYVLALAAAFLGTWELIGVLVSLRVIATVGEAIAFAIAVFIVLLGVVVLAVRGLNAVLRPKP